MPAEGLQPCPHAPAAQRHKADSDEAEQQQPMAVCIVWPLLCAALLVAGTAIAVELLVGHQPAAALG
jgi:hypothetical protein